MTKTEKIAVLQKKIMDLKKIYNNDVGASYKESTQTQDILQLYEKQLQQLKESTNAIVLAEIVLQNKKQEKIKFSLVDSSPDPSARQITASSPLGKKLLDCLPGQKIIYLDQEYTVISRKQT